MKTLIFETCRDICEDPYKIICFAYEIRKQDAEQESKENTQKDYYTNLLLKDV